MNWYKLATLEQTTHPDKADFSPYIEMVPTGFLYNIRNKDATNWTTNQSGEKMTMDELKQSIEEEGFIDPFIISICGDKIRLEEGNHRIQIAKEIGEEKLPAVVKILKKFPMNKHHKHEYDLPEEFVINIPDKEFAKPSEVLKI
jgi:hypothetical protein